MVFQDFDIVRERRRQERLRKLKKRITIAVVIFVLAGIVAVAAFVFMSTKDGTKNATKKDDGDGKKDDNKPKDNKPPATPSTPPTTTTTPSVPKGQVDPKEFVQSICNGSTYKILCSMTLTKNLEKNPDSMKQPKQLVKSFITSTNEELDKALTKAGTIGLKTEADKKAFGVCQELIGDAKEELQSAADEAEKIDTAKLPTNGDLSAQLSAVMSYQEACVDSFPEGQSKNDFKTNFNTSQVYTSNSLAMVKQLATLMKLGSDNNINNNTTTITTNTTTNNNKNNNTNINNNNTNTTTNTTTTTTNNNNKNNNNTNTNNNNNKINTNTNTTTTTNNNNNNKINTNTNTNTTTNNNNNNKINTNTNTNTNNNNNNNINTQAKRNLLQTGFPSWLNIEQHRELKEEGGDEKSKMPTPNVTVSQDGSGQFKTISEALAAMPKKYDGRYVIFVKAGTYVENVIVTKKMVNLTIYGEGSQKSIITGTKNTADGTPLYLTASFVAAGRGFMARAMGFRNTAGPDKQQALSARISSDKSIFLNCRFEGYANTLYVQTHRQFYKSCVIKGTVDFIFGDAAAVFQNCEIYVRKPKDNQKNTVTAQSRKDEFETTGIVIQSSKIMADETFKADAKRFKSYLGRPTKRYSRTIVIETQIDEFIDPAGWLEFEGQKDFGLDTLVYGEFNNAGPGAKTASRVKWAGRKDINKDEAMKYTVGIFLQGSWVKETGAPVRMELGS